jgi:glucosamine--fructose-6-phosphate aminotransferase (isomerizing)
MNELRQTTASNQSQQVISQRAAKENCMCGIVGIVGEVKAAPLLVKSLTRLEYRGYDSCGVATIAESGIEVRKDVGAVSEIAEGQGLIATQGCVGIAHTRWATHGGVSRENAHPHLSCDGHFAVVHNGIISNHHALRADLQRRGHIFSSETDTEVFAHLLEETYQPGVSVEEAFVKALHFLEGTFAIVMISRYDAQKIFCAREQSPLLLGLAPGMNFIGSDVNAFLPYTQQAIVLEDGEYAVLSRTDYCVRGISDGEIRTKSMAQISWSTETAEKGGFQHYMEKEIWEQPEAIQRAMAIPQQEIVALARQMLESRRTLLIGVGTTHYVALFGQYLLAALAGEFAPALSSDEVGALGLMDPETFVLGISQSGETFDTLQALRQAKAAGARTAAIINVPGSTMTREVGSVVLQNSGPEICVISTKAAMAQMVILLRLAAEVSRLKRHGSATQPLRIFKDLNRLPEQLMMVLRTQQLSIRRLARRYQHQRNWLFLGRGLYTPIAF